MKVTILSPYPGSEHIPNIEEIGLEENLFENFTAQMSSTFLKGDLDYLQMFGQWMKLIAQWFQMFTGLLKQKPVKEMFQSKSRHYDAVLTMAVAGTQSSIVFLLIINKNFTEAGYYLARRKFNSTLISYFAQ